MPEDKKGQTLKGPLAIPKEKNFNPSPFLVEKLNSGGNIGQF